MRDLFKRVTAAIEARAAARLAKRAAAGRTTLPGELRQGAGVSANRLLSAISGAFRYGVEHFADRDPRLEDRDNPARGWSTLRRAEAGRSVKIDPADIAALWRAFDAAPAPWPTIYRLILLTGARRGEIEGLRTDEIRDLDGRDARLELGSRSKAGEGLDRVIALTPTAARSHAIRHTTGRSSLVWIARYRPVPRSMRWRARQQGCAITGTSTASAGYWPTGSARLAWISRQSTAIGHQLLGARSRYGRRPPVAASAPLWRSGRRSLS